MTNEKLYVQNEAWFKHKRLTPERLEQARRALQEVRNGIDVRDAIRHNPIPKEFGGGYINKQMIVSAYREMVEQGEIEADSALLAKIRMKPSRTQSGVTVVTVLTKPYPCPGKCVFCPTDWRMPKSYLPDEPGAMRALHHKFDPYDQVMARMQQLDMVGHPTDKIELLILGGTWSSYQRDYQEWFIQRCFDAMNGVELPSLPEAQKYNQTTEHRNVGLVIETRPDHVDNKEIAWLRYLGVTKVQMGAQSFDEHILEINKRGHTAVETLRATNLLRAAGFKIVLHWMPNLLGATPESDIEDFARTWQEYCPDELKIYPNQLLENAELYLIWQQGQFQPYTEEALMDLLLTIKPTIPRYCRVNRIVRDIPSNNVVEGNKRTSMRMDLHRVLEERGTPCQCVRCREVRGKAIEADALTFADLIYPAGYAEEHFLSFNTPEDKLAGFLRLSLPGEESPDTGQVDLQDAAIIREVHVYGQSLEVGGSKQGAAQHIGLGTKLIEQAVKVAKESGFEKLAVIAAVGTREYYAGRGFEMGETYMVKKVSG